MDEAIDSGGPDLWCRGCVRVGARELADAERAWIKRLRGAHRARAALGFVIVPAALAVCVGLGTLLPQGPSGSAGIVAGTALFVTLLLGVPVSILLVRDHLAASRKLEEDLEHGSAWIFESSAPAAAEIGADDDETGHEPVAFALLPQSRRLVDPHDATPRVACEDVIEVEPHTGPGLYAPCAYAVVRHPPGLRLEQRPLSAAERDELRRVARGLLVPTIGTVIALAGFIAIASLVLFVRPSSMTGSRGFVGDSISTVLWLLVSGRILIRYWRCVRMGHRLRGDLTVGIVLRAAGDQDPDSEFLPISRLLWRTAGAPIQWRDRNRGVKRLRSVL
jgi:hypothetical protein